ncbi:polyphosphate kinase 1 [Paenibacillus beijingensis]|uniref:polyphosphate kinase 1 n=1 Tax=Paenibacillus beijingensis TaxID=1126833 RepID=UPI0009E28791|nr:polyphosphate kinase 1 [Paenibacillus beijingensis]
MASCKYINRDLSWLEFNRRVLGEAQNEHTPLLERAKFLAIVSSNLDEFMSVRVAGIRNDMINGITAMDFSGYSPAGVLKRIIRRTERLVNQQYATLRQVLDRLASYRVTFASYEDLTDAQKQEADTFFYRKVFPAIQPVLITEKESLPLLLSNRLYFSVVLRPANTESPDEFKMALIEFPDELGRYFELSPVSSTLGHTFLMLETLIKAHISVFFNEQTVADVRLFRIIRDSELSLEEQDAEDLLVEVERKLRRRKRGAPVRLEVEQDIHPHAYRLLTEHLNVEGNIAVINGPVDLSFLMKFSQSLPGFDHFKYPKHKAVYPVELKKQSIFSVLQQRDVAVFHPFESFDAFDDFIEQAAGDPAVSSIKMTLYRVSKQSRIVRSLVLAAGNGKDVTVIVELKARFDEERNIAWAKKLEKAGCRVIHGWIGLKIHAKMTLIERREPDGLKKYAHLSTGNYNGQSAKLYTDIGLFTAHAVIADDVANLFNEISDFRTHLKSKMLAVSPTDLRDTVYSLIEREMKNAAAGLPAKIIAKMNSLSDPAMIDKLYEASGAGVQIELIVRGICCLCPGIPGQSENIKVRSIVDRFLEHSRLYYFKNGGNDEVWLSSADWMTRNLSRRIEVMCPVSDPAIRQIITLLLTLQLKDNVKSHQLLTGGKYKKTASYFPYIRSQYRSLPLIVYRKHVSSRIPFTPWSGRRNIMDPFTAADSMKSY